MFKNFYIKDLFEVINNPQLDKKNFTFSESAEYPYFTRTENNNGILGYVEYLDEKHKIKGNSLAVGMISMRFYYMHHDFYAGQFTKTLIPKFQGFNEKLAIYFMAILNKHSEYYQSFLVRHFKDKVSETVVSLPVIESPGPDHEYTVDDIDFEYMQECIAELEQERIAELDAYLVASGLDDYELTDEDKEILSLSPESASDEAGASEGNFGNGQVVFKAFKIGDTFNKVEAKCKQENFDKKRDTSNVPNEEYCIPLVNAKVGDNGIMFYGRKSDWNTQEMCIDVIQNGVVATGTVYAQPQPVGVLWDAYLIKPNAEVKSVEALLYMAKCIEKITKEQFSYDKKATWDRVKLCEISLPITSSGSINFDYMERYIRAIEKLAIADVAKYKDRLIATTKQVVGM